MVRARTQEGDVVALGPPGQSGLSPCVPEGAGWRDSKVTCPFTFGIHGSRALALGPPSPARVGLSPQFGARLPKKRAEGLPVLQSSSWQQPGCQGLPELALAVSMATGGSPAPSVSRKGAGLGPAALEPRPWGTWGPAPPWTRGCWAPEVILCLTIACHHFCHVLPDVPSGHPISLCCPSLPHSLLCTPTFPRPPAHTHPIFSSPVPLGLSTFLL